jgi:hypothetical protein
MESILLSKFSGYYLRSKLMKTGDVNLIEGNYWHDNYWEIVIVVNVLKLKDKIF